jgi:hypothetical protein
VRQFCAANNALTFCVLLAVIVQAEETHAYDSLFVFRSVGLAKMEVSKMDAKNEGRGNGEKGKRGNADKGKRGKGENGETGKRGNGEKGN